MARTGGKTSYTRDDVLELVAAVYAAGDLIDSDEIDLSPEARRTAVDRLGLELEYRFFGRYDLDDQGGDGDEYWENDPTELELRARSAEIEADLIADGYQQKVDDAAMNARFEGKDGRSARLRLWAERLREAGSQKGVYFPSEDEMREVARAREGADAR